MILEIKRLKRVIFMKQKKVTDPRRTYQKLKDKTPIRISQIEKRIAEIEKGLKENRIVDVDKLKKPNANQISQMLAKNSSEKLLIKQEALGVGEDCAEGNP